MPTGLLDNAINYWITEPNEVGYSAYDKAAQQYGKSGEWSKADAAKHMAWQAELANRTMLPKMLAVPLANTIGVGKEVVVDGLGGLLDSVINRKPLPTDTWKNSLMDIWSNSVGANALHGSSSVSDDAVRLAGDSRKSLIDALLNGKPYAPKQ